MNKSGIEIAELYEIANLLLRRRHWPFCNGLDLLCGNRSFTRRHNIAQIFHLLQTEETLFKAKLQALLFELLKHKTQVIQVFLKSAAVNTDVIEVDSNELT
jgi:hypothetical protein